MDLTVGRIVHYRLTKTDATAINKRRADAAEHLGEHHDNSNGVQIHVGNSVSEGDIFPAVAVRIFSLSSANFKVFLDGSDDYWATSRSLGDYPGGWSWPTVAK